MQAGVHNQTTLVLAKEAQMRISYHGLSLLKFSEHFLQLQTGL